MKYIKTYHKILEFYSNNITTNFGNIAVYSPNQIKSATDNNGDFDINNPNVNL